ncbi:MAG: hypothetical protein Q4G71_15295 [Pseudomonadota bacterium]|nr:hypothetical protein [Pseudomonadota bacterium]
MALFDTLQQILANATNPNPRDVDQLSREAPKAELSQGVADALRSDQTPELGDTLAALFENASPQDRADLLNMLTERFGPGALGGVAGGALAGHEGAGTPQVDVAKADQLTPTQVRDVTTAAAQAEPGLMDRIGNFYAEHPDLVKTLGAGALMVALARMKQNLTR